MRTDATTRAAGLTSAEARRLLVEHGPNEIHRESATSPWAIGLAPICAWSGRGTHERPAGRETKGKLAFRRQEAR